MIVRSPRPTQRFTIISNDVIRDRRLSYKAHGILHRLLSMPDNWRTSAEELARHSPDGLHAVRAGLRELEAVGYIRRQKLRDDLGRIRTVTTVFDSPSPESGFPTSDNRSSLEEPTKNN